MSNADLEARGSILELFMRVDKLVALVEGVVARVQRLEHQNVSNEETLFRKPISMVINQSTDCIDAVCDDGSIWRISNDDEYGWWEETAIPGTKRAFEKDRE